MAWYGFDGVWTKRAAITLDVSGGANPQDFDLVIPKGWDDFWRTIDASGEELRVVSSSGTLMGYGFDPGGFNLASRTGELRLNNVATPGVACAQCAWLYYGSTSAQGSAATAAGTGGASAHIELGRPAGPYVTGQRPAIPGSARPLDTFAKTAAEIADLWVNVSGQLSRTFTAANAAHAWEEALYITQTVEDDTGADQTAMYDVSRIRFVWLPRGGMWLRAQVIGGTSGSMYTSSLLVRSQQPGGSISSPWSTFDARVGWRVQTVRLTS